MKSYSVKLTYIFWWGYMVPHFYIFITAKLVTYIGCRQNTYTLKHSKYTHTNGPKTQAITTPGDGETAPISGHPRHRAPALSRRLALTKTPHSYYSVAIRA